MSTSKPIATTATATATTATTATTPRQRKSRHKSISNDQPQNNNNSKVSSEKVIVNDKNEKCNVKKGIQQKTITGRTVGTSSTKHNTNSRSSSSSSSSGNTTTGSSRTNNAYTIFVVVNILLVATGIFVFSYTIISVRSHARSHVGTTTMKNVGITSTSTTISVSGTLTNQQEQEQQQTQQEQQEQQQQQQDEAQIQDNNNDDRKKEELLQVTRLGSYTLLETLPHDTDAFTQGLVTVTCPSYNNSTQSYFIEGTGLKGQSNIRLVSIQTGIVLQQITLSYNYFGEGITTYTVLDDEDDDDDDKDSTTSTDTTNSDSTSVSNTSNHNQQQYSKQYPNPKQRIIQLTWQEETAFLYDLSFEQETMIPNNTTNTTAEITKDYNCIPKISKVMNNASNSHSQQDKYKNKQQQQHQQQQQQQQQQFKYKTSTTTKEGWGITYRNDLHIFYVSDGSSNIHIWDGITFEQIHVLPITFIKSTDLQTKIPLNYINELEWDPITKTILCNVWYQNIIVRICPISGHVLCIYDVQSLYTNRPSTVDCLNGIALVPNTTNNSNNTNNTNQIYVTGKLWPNLYRIQLIDHPTATM